jgi:hypothetical protein
MNHSTVIFDPYAAADLRNMVQTIVCNHNIAITGQAEWYPVAFFLKDENGEVLGGLLGDIWAAWLHVRTLAEWTDGSRRERLKKMLTKLSGTTRNFSSQGG